MNFKTEIKKISKALAQVRIDIPPQMCGYEDKQKAKTRLLRLKDKLGVLQASPLIYDAYETVHMDIERLGMDIDMTINHSYKDFF